MPITDLSPGIVQREGRSLLFKITRDNQVFPLDDCHAIFVMKLLRGDPDSAAVIVRRSADYPAVGDYPAGPGDESQIAYVSLPVPNGGSEERWGLRVILPSDLIAVALATGQYYVQVDIVPADPTLRFPAVQGYLTILPTGIQEM